MPKERVSSPTKACRAADGRAIVLLAKAIDDVRRNAMTVVRDDNGSVNSWRREIRWSRYSVLFDVGGQVRSSLASFTA